MDIGKVLQTLWETSGFNNLFLHWENAAMILIACVLIYLAIVKKFEPLLLLGIAFGMLLTNLPLGGLMHMEFYQSMPVDYGQILHEGGLLDILYLGVKLGIYPCLIFLGIGAMTDFGPLLSRPSSLLLGAAAQLGIYCAFILASLLGFLPNVAASIGIIG
ncbi:MAG: sodium ion-translocating decarboxylase subunit beta, partial [Oscillospiraceae bacterium]|nr:sodium ion-translocating decarboxylase subunit beta [Oscillospiraceae bacterium]